MSSSSSSSSSSDRGRATRLPPPRRGLNSDASPVRGSKRSIAIDISEGHQLCNPVTKQPVTNPRIHIGFGRGSAVTPIGKSHAKDRFKFEARTELPYNGESTLRFLLVDGSLQLGFKDINIEDAIFPDMWEGPVALMGRSNKPCGTINVVIQKTNRKIQPGWLKAPEIVAGGNEIPRETKPAGAGSRSSSSSSSSSSDDDMPSLKEPTTKPNKFRSCKITLFQGDSLISSKTGRMPEKPYVVARFGKSHLRTSKVSSAGDHVTFNQTMKFPYAQTRFMTLSVSDDLSMARDPPCGSSVIDMDRYLFVGPQRVVLPVAHKGVPTGTINALIDFSDDSQNKAVIETVGTAAATRSVSASSSSSSSSSASSKGVTKIPTSVKNAVTSMKLQLIETSDDLGKHPYVTARVGPNWLRSSSAVNSPSFHETMVFPYHGEKHMKVVVLRDLKMRKDPTMGTTRINLEPYVSKETAGEIISIPLAAKDGAKCGVMKVKILSSKETYIKSFVRPEGPDNAISMVSVNEGVIEESHVMQTDVASVHCRAISATNMKPEKAQKHLNPYVKCHFGDTLLSGSSSDTVKDQEVYPFQDKFILPYKSFKNLTLSVYNDVPMARDVLIGQHDVNIDMWLRDKKGKQVVDLPLVGPKGGAVGTLKVELDLQDSRAERAQVVKVKSSAPNVSFKSYQFLIKNARDLINPKPSIDTLDPYVQLVFGKEEAQTKVQKNAGCNPTFNEAFEVPVSSIRTLVLNVYDNAHMAKDPLLGSTTLNLDNLNLYDYKESNLVVPLTGKKGQAAGLLNVAAITSAAGCDKLKSIGQSDHLIATPESPVADRQRSVSSNSDKENSGIAKPRYDSFFVLLENARGLVNPKKGIDTVDPYVVLTHGKSSVTSAVQKDAGCNPDFNERFVCPTHHSNYLRFDVFDQAHLAKDPLLGSGTVDVSLYPTKTTQPLAVRLMTKKGKPAGILNFFLMTSSEKCSVAKSLGSETKTSQIMKEEENRVMATHVETVHATMSSDDEDDIRHNSFVVKVLNARGLVNPKPKIDTLDPYVKITHGKGKVTSAVMKDAGVNPDFNEQFELATVQQSRAVIFEVFDRAHMSSDPLLGTGTVDAGDIILNSDKTFPIALLGKGGKPAGMLNVSMQGSSKSITTAKSLGAIPVSKPSVANDSSITSSSSTQELKASPHAKVDHQSFVLLVKNARDLVNHKSVVDTADPYVVIAHGTHTLKSAVRRNAGNNPEFNELFEFPSSDSRTLRFEVFDKTVVGSDQLLGVGLMDAADYPVNCERTVAVKLLDKKNKPAGILNVDINTGTRKLTDAKALGVKSQVEVKEMTSSSSSSSSSSHVVKEVVDTTRNHKSFFVVIKNARNLVHTKSDKIDTMDPYVTLKHGTSKVEGAVAKNAGSSPDFYDEKFVLPTQPAGQTLDIELHDHAHIVRDSLLGTASVDLRKFPTKLNTPVLMEVPLVDKKGKPAGFVNMTVETLAGLCSGAKTLGRTSSPKPHTSPGSTDLDVSLIGARSNSSSSLSDDNRLTTVKESKHTSHVVPVNHDVEEKTKKTRHYKSFSLMVKSAQDLKNPKASIDTLDPYVTIQHSDFKAKTTVKKDAGIDPDFHESFVIPASDYRYVSMEVYDKAHLSSDPLLGKCSLDLDSIDLKIDHPQPFKLMLKDKKGRDGVGALYVVVTPSDKAVAPATAATATTATIVTATSVKEESNSKSQKTAIYQGVELEVVKVTDLINPKSEKIDTLDPYVMVKLGPESLKGTVHKDGGSSCNIDDVFFFPYAAYQYIKVEVFDRAHLSKDPLLGATRINLDNFCADPTNVHKMKIPLLSSKGATGSGFVFLKLNMLETASGTAHVTHKTSKKMKSDTSRSESDTATAASPPKMRSRADSSASSSSHGETLSVIKTDAKWIKVDLLNSFNTERTEKVTSRIVNPYVVGRLGDEVLRSRTVAGGQDSASYQEVMNFVYTGQRKLKLSVYDNYKMGKDTMLGYSKIDLDQLLGGGDAHEGYVTCHLFNAKTSKSAGTLTVRVSALKEKISKSYLETGRKESKTVVKDYNSRAVHFEEMSLSDVTVPKNVESLNPYPMIAFADHELRGRNVERSDGSAIFTDRFSFSTAKAPATANISVYDNRRHAIDTLVGSGLIKVHEMAAKGTERQHFEVPLLDKKGVHRGTIRGVMIMDNTYVKDSAHLSSNKQMSAAMKTDLLTEKELLSLGGVRGQIIEVVPLTGDNYTKAYVESTLGKKELRLNYPGDLAYDEEFEYAYQPNQTLKLDLRDDLRMKRDPHIGVGSVQVDDVLRSGGVDGQNVVVPITNDENSVVAHLVLLLMGVKPVVTKARVLVGKVGTTPTPVMASAEMSPIKSFRATVLEVTGAEKLKKPYLFVETGKHEAKMTNACVPGAKETMECPYKPGESAIVKLMEDVKFRKDPTVASGTLNLDQSMDLNGPRTVSVNLKQTDGSAGGKVMFLLTPSENAVTASRVLPVASVSKNRKSSLAGEPADPATAPSTVTTDVTHMIVECVSAASLINPRSEKIDTLDPYVVVKFGSDELKGVVQKDAGSNPRFSDNFTFPYQPLRFLKVRVCDKAHLTKDPVLGEATVDVDNLLQKNEELHRIMIPLYLEGKPAGSINCKFHLKRKDAQPLRVEQRALSKNISSETHTATGEYLTNPSIYKALHLTIHKIEDITDVDAFGSMDPYAKVHLGNLELRSDVFANAGTTVDVHTTFSFPYNQERFVKVSIFDENKVRSDKVAGEASLDLTPYVEGDTLKCIEGISVVLPMTIKGKKQGCCKGTIKLARNPIPQPSTLKATYGATVVTE